MAEKKHNRRNFIRLAGSSVVIGTLVLWDRLVHSHKLISRKSEVKLPFNPNTDFTFHDDVIIINNENGIAAYSAKCTHLGCNIHEVINGNLVCPCHGSEFDHNGIPLKGPAVRPLKQLNYSVDFQNQQITIEL